MYVFFTFKQFRTNQALRRSSTCSPLTFLKGKSSTPWAAFWGGLTSERR